MFVKIDDILLESKIEMTYKSNIKLSSLYVKFRGIIGGSKPIINSPYDVTGLNVTLD